MLPFKLFCLLMKISNALQLCTVQLDGDAAYSFLLEILSQLLYGAS